MGGAPADKCKLPQAFWRSLEHLGLPPGVVLRQARLNGGAGSYSNRSWVSLPTSSPRNSASSVSPKSIPAVMPPPVMRLRSTTTRSWLASTPSASRTGCVAQWVAAR